jgi:N-acetylneuraminic acid mutarotase
MRIGSPYFRKAWQFFLILLIWLGGYFGSLFFLPNPLLSSSGHEMQYTKLHMNFQIFGNGSWANVGPTTMPLARGYHALVYDLETDRTLLYAGADQYYHAFQDTWSYDYNTNTWENRTPATSPPPLGAHALAYDSKNEVVILFGGDIDPFLSTAETWAYDNETNTWTNRTTSVAPPPRSGHSMVYDSQSERIILFGGQYWDGQFEYAYHDTWIYNYDTNQWTNVTPAISPGNRMFYCMSYDVEFDRTIIFGGFSGGSGMTRTGFNDETWVFDLETSNWAELTTIQAPGARAYGKMVYHSAIGCSILYGGWNEELGQYYSDTWAFDYSTTTWTQLDVSPSPNICLRHQMVYDNESERIILFSGATTQFNYQQATWTFEFTPSTIPPPPPFPGFPIESILIGIFIGILCISIIRRKKQK